MTLRRILFLPVLSQVLAAQGWVTFYSAYEDGLEAQRRGDHALAVRAFSQAIAMQPRPGRQVKTYGLNFLATYHPYLRLTESRLALLELPEAEAALKHSEALGLEPGEERRALAVRLHMLQAAVPAVGVPKSAPAAPAPEPGPRIQEVKPSAAPPLEDIQPAAEAAPSAVPSTEATPKLGPPPVRNEPKAVRDSTPLPQAGGAATPRSEPLPPPRGVPSPEPSMLRLSWMAAGLAGVLGGWWWLRTRRRASRPRSSKDHLPSEMPLGEDRNLGRRFGAYLARRRLSAGGCATAYLGTHASDGTQVAIKVPHPHLLMDQAFLHRFQREASLGGLLQHPRIARTLEIAPEGTSPWIVFEYVQGTTLRAKLEQEGALPVPLALKLASDIAGALAHAHAKGVVHRDLKPGNVMVTADGAVVLDFGIARVLDAAMTQTSQFMGTPAYAAPEALDSSKAGPAADRYALGLILYEMLAGERPFPGLDGFELLEAHRYRELPDLQARCALPQGLWRLIQRLCAKAPEARPEDGETQEILARLCREYPTT